MPPFDHALYLAVHLTPNAAAILLTFGIFMVYVELNRPGTIVPGCVGLCAVLFAITSIGRFSLSPFAVILIFIGIFLLLFDLFLPEPLIVSVVATFTLILGLSFLATGPPSLRIRPIVAISCGLILGAGTSVLTRIARRARLNKAVD